MPDQTTAYEQSTGSHISSQWYRVLFTFGCITLSELVCRLSAEGLILLEYFFVRLQRINTIIIIRSGDSVIIRSGDSGIIRSEDSGIIHYLDFPNSSKKVFI